MSTAEPVVKPVDEEVIFCNCQLHVEMENFEAVTSPKDLATRISELVSSGNTNEALTLLQEDRYRELVGDNSWELIPVLTQHLSEASVTATPQFFDCSCSLLREIAEKSNPKEVLIGLLEEAEDRENHVKFMALLDPLKRVLLRFQSKRVQSLELCLEVVISHLNFLPLPTNHILEGEERLLLDADPCVDRITKIYFELIAFYEPFVALVSSECCSSHNNTHCCERNLLITHLLMVLGKPLAFLDMDYDDNSTKSASRTIAEKLLAYLNNLVSDIFMFMNVVEERETQKNENSCIHDDCESHLCTVDCNVKTLSFAMLYFLILGEGVGLSSVPCVYNTFYLLHRVLYLVSFLLRQSGHMLVHKGLRLASTILSRFSKGEVPSDVLESSNHKNFSQTLCNVLIFSELKENRILALKILKKYLFIFDDKGRYLLLCNLPEVCNHDGAMELLVSTFKDMIYEANLGGYPRSKYFMGGHLKSLLFFFATFAHGVETDLMEIAKQILASLNLIRFLVLYDKKGVLGIQDAVPELEQRLLEPLKRGLTLSRAHYELKLRELKEEESQIVKHKESKVSITISGKTLPNLPVESKVSVVMSALQCFDLMEFSLSQVQDYIKECDDKK